MENLEAVMKKKEMYFAAMKGKVEFLEAQSWSDEYLHLKTSEKNNIIHIAIQYEQHKFIEAILEKFPHEKELICEKNSKEDTPLHVAAEVGNYDIVSLLFGYLEKNVEGDESAEKPWMARNLEGNTAVHVAIIHDNVKIAKFLLVKNVYFACVVNKSKEAPLHLAVKQHVNYSETERILEQIRQPINKGGAALAINFTAEENMSDMIELLVKKASYVASWPDAKGMTPLHRAASLSSPYNVHVIRFIIEHWPQSAEVRDGSGKSILHHLVNKIPNYKKVRKVLNLKEIYTLRNRQDQLGNTPLLMAAKSRDKNMVRVLLESSAKLNINNSEGICATSVIQQQNVIQILRQRKMTEEESENAERANITYLRGRIEADLLLSQDSKGKNILHKLMHIKNGSRIVRDNYVHFIKEVLEIFPALLSQTDHDWNTPVHVLVRNNDVNIHIDTRNHSNSQQINIDVDSDDDDSIINGVVQPSSLWKSDLLSELLDICSMCINNIQKDESNRAHNNTPWFLQNTHGNTTLHEAVIAKNKALVLILLKQDKKSACVVNKHKETPLHLLAGAINMEPFDREVMDKMVEANVEAAYLPDEKGLTPILRAFKAGNMSTAKMLCGLCPEAAEYCDHSRQNVWHLLIRQSSRDYEMYNVLLQDEGFRGLLQSKDKNEDTPLHLAITLNHFYVVKFLIDWDNEHRYLRSRKRELSSNNKGEWLLDLLEIPNKVGVTPADLIADSPSLPSKLERCLMSDPRFRGLRSSWRIPRTQLQNYMNSMNIIAALQTTITFTAAFTVPGGLIQEVGTPILIRSIAFQVFMISDVIAMCLSMMVLICLLWMVATDKRESVMIQDFAVSLLLASFVATLLTFMMGVYATIFPVKPWIAIVTLVLCSLLMLLIHRFMVTKLLLPLKISTVNFVQVFLGPAARLFTKTIKKLRRSYDL